MKTIELIGHVDEQRRLHAKVPKEIPAGQVRLIVFLPGEDEAGGVWNLRLADHPEKLGIDEALAVDSDFTHRFTARPGPLRR